MMRLSVAILAAALVTGSLVACSNGYGVPPTALISTNGSTSKTSATPVELHSSGILDKIHAAAGFGRADAVEPGIYTSTHYGTTSGPYGSVYAYRNPDRSNGAPVCSVGTFGWAAGIAVDRRGDLIVPDLILGTITVYAGPRLCGPELGSFVPRSGAFIAGAVASLNAANGEILVGYRDAGVAGPSVSVCTLSGGCTVNLKIPKFAAYGVALAPNGDCWASGFSKYGRQPTLVFFAHCRGHAVFTNGLAGDSLDIDDKGNLVAISSTSYTSQYRGPSQLYIYSGCNPKCKRVGSPFQLKGGVYGHLDANSKHLVVADNLNSQLDIYSYSANGIRYEYSISNGLPPPAVVTGAAFSPPSKE